MDRWHRHIPAPFSRLRGLGAPSCLSTLFCLSILAIQLAIPVAQIWHVAADHIPVVTLSEQHQSDPSTTFRVQSASHQGDELDEALYCPVCQAFVSMHDVVDILSQVATDIEQSTGQLSLTDTVVCQIFLLSSASRAPPVFS